MEEPPDLQVGRTGQSNRMPRQAVNLYGHCR